MKTYQVWIKLLQRMLIISLCCLVCISVTACGNRQKENPLTDPILSDPQTDTSNTEISELFNEYLNKDMMMEYNGTDKRPEGWIVASDLVTAAEVEEITGIKVLSSTLNEWVPDYSAITFKIEGESNSIYPPAVSINLSHDEYSVANLTMGHPQSIDDLGDEAYWDYVGTLGVRIGKDVLWINSFLPKDKKTEECLNSAIELAKIVLKRLPER